MNPVSVMEVSGSNSMEEAIANIFIFVIAKDNPSIFTGILHSNP